MGKAMTRLPEKELLSGAKTPQTTTGEMKRALGSLRDFLAELFGEDSSEKEAARKTLGIDLSALASRAEMQGVLLDKADRTEVLAAMSAKADREELAALEAEIAKRGTPIGSIDYFAMATPPAGYLRADGAEVGRETYPDLFDAIGTVFGAGNGETTFNLPDLTGRFPQGSAVPGQKMEAGLPNITGGISNTHVRNNVGTQGTGYGAVVVGNNRNAYTGSLQETTGSGSWSFDASLSNPVYGNSGTVQPPSLTLLPCIKAFDAATNPGLVDITELAGEMNGKLGKTIDGKLVRYVTDSLNDGSGWYRKWSDGWLEQGGELAYPAATTTEHTLNFHVPFQSPAFSFTGNSTYIQTSGGLATLAYRNKTAGSIVVLVWGDKQYSTGFSWYACGQGSQV